MPFDASKPYSEAPTKSGFNPAMGYSDSSTAPQEKPDFGGSAKAFGLSAASEGIKTGGLIAGAELGAEGGAALGAFGGPFAPVTVPVGGILGSLVGGIGGYYGMDKLGDKFGLTKDQTKKMETEHPTATEAGKLAVDLPTVAYGVYGLGKSLAPVAGKLVKAGLGVPSRSTEEIAKAFEKRGYKLEPGQLKADDPYHSPGFMGNKIANQKLANKEASAVTGREAGKTGIDQKFLDERFETLGKEYDRIYASKPEWTIDKTALEELADLHAQEVAAVPGQVRPVTATTNAYKDARVVPAKDLARTISELKRIARTASDGNDRHAASQAIKILDDNLARNHPEVGSALKKLNPQYRATIALQDLADAKGIRGGNISLRKLGDKAPKLIGNPLYELAQGGRELNLAARWEGAGTSGVAPETLLSPSKLARTLATTTGARSQLARGLQRRFPGD